MSGTLKFLIVMAIALALVLVIGGTTGASTEPQVVRVTLTDNQITLSRVVVESDRAITLVVTNAGELTHKLVVQPYANDVKMPMIESPVIGPHTTQPVKFTLEKGVYRIECLQVDHAERGMVTAIVSQSILQQSLHLPTDLLIPLLALVLGSAYIIADTFGLRLAAK